MDFQLVKWSEDAGVANYSDSLATLVSAKMSKVTEVADIGTTTPKYGPMDSYANGTSMVQKG